MELYEVTAIQAQDGLAKKKFSSQELTASCLQRIKKLDPKIKAFLTVTENKALDAAKKADQVLAQDEEIFEKKPLLGIPFSAKDVYVTKGVKTTAASKVLRNYIPQYDATVIQRAKRAGAHLIGKENCDAWGHGVSTENSDFVTTKNPWNLNYVPGGSCGGSGASLTAGMSFFSIGEDTGGSIRLPAAYCNIVGLKVTYGRVSRYGAIAFASSLDTVGPMARTVEDCALVMYKIAGRDFLDATSISAAVPDYPSLLRKGIKDKRIGLPKEYYGQGLNKEIRSAIGEAVRKFEKLGAKTVEIRLPSTDAAINTYYIINPSETSSNLARYDGVRYGCKRLLFGDEAKRRIMLGTYSLSAGYYEAFYKKAMRVRTLVKKDFEEAFQKVDLIIAPVAPTPPFKIGEKIDDPIAMYLTDVYSVSINLAGIPALALPCGFTKNNLPIGMQIIGPQFSEDLLLRAGYAYEQVTDWHKRKPDLTKI